MKYITTISTFSKDSPFLGEVLKGITSEKIYYLKSPTL